MTGIRIVVALIMLLVLSAPAVAETQPLAWAVKHRPIAQRTSDILVGAQLVADTVHSLRSERRGRALGCQALRMGIAFGASELVKRATDRERPDRSDRLSFYSGHTATAFSAGGWRWQISAPIAIGSGYLRMAANRHYISDVLVGAGAGYLTSRICRAETGRRR